MTIATLALCFLSQAPGAPDRPDEEGGRELPAAQIKGSLVRFSADRVVVTDKNTKEIFGATDTLGTIGTPRWVTLVSKIAPIEGTVAQGLIEKEGDTVRLIYALPGGKAPTEFKTGEKQLRFVMKGNKAKERKEG